LSFLNKKKELIKSLFGIFNYVKLFWILNHKHNFIGCKNKNGGLYDKN